MRRSSPLAVLLAGALLLPAARAQQAGPLPLERVPAASAPAEGRTRVFRLARRLAARIPALAGLDVPTRGTLRLAVIPIEFPDRPRPAAFASPSCWEQSLFSRGSYRRTPTGEPAFGSLADFYAENSGGALQVEGKVFDWVRVPTPRATLDRLPAFLPLSDRLLFRAALDALRAREGAGALQGYHALAFVTAGGWADFRGGVLWPHAGALFDRGRAWSYYTMHAGEQYFEPVGVHCHEFGHVLGILDKYGTGEGTGLGQWCLMAQGGHGGRTSGVALSEPTSDPCQVAGRRVREQVASALGWLQRTFNLPELRLPGEEARPRQRTPGRPLPWTPNPAGVRPRTGEERPLHLCAVCKSRLGWSSPRALDPNQPARFYLTAVEEDPRQVARVLLDPRGRESLILEYRRQVGFDGELPREGLLVWRTGSPGASLRTFVPFEQVELIPAHGQRSVDAALRDPLEVPFPAGERRSLRVGGLLPGAWTVELSGIRAEDGRLSLELRRVAD